MNIDVDAREQTMGTPIMLIITTFLNEFDDNSGRREMPEFLILSMAGTTARLLASRDEGRT